MTLLKGYEIKEDKFGASMDKKVGDFQDTALEFNIPK